MNWMDFFMEIPISGERGVAKGFLLVNFQKDPGSGMWKKFWSEISEWDPAWGTG